MGLSLACERHKQFYFGQEKRQKTWRKCGCSCLRSTALWREISRQTLVGLDGHMKLIPSMHRERDTCISGCGGTGTNGREWRVLQMGILATVEPAGGRSSADNNAEGSGSGIRTLDNDVDVRSCCCGEARLSQGSVFLLAKYTLHCTVCPRCVFHSTRLRSLHMVSCVTTKAGARRTHTFAQRFGADS